MVEFFNVHLGHYFYTATDSEARGIDAGQAGAGWVRTGLGFDAYRSLETSGGPTYANARCDQLPTPCVPVSRFYSYGPNSHFYTGDRAEADFLKRPGTGWTYENDNFFLPIPQAGQCASGTPVYRFYNNRFVFNDSNHRFTASEPARQRMIAAGWIDEGIAFCAYGAASEPVQTLKVSTADPASVRTAAECLVEARAGQSCIAIDNVPIPDVGYEPAPSSYNVSSADEFNSRTGIVWMGNSNLALNLASAASSREQAAADVFVQFTDWKDFFGLHLSTVSRGPSRYSSLTPLYKLRTQPPAPGQPEQRLFPFRVRHATDYELAMSFFVGLRVVTAVPLNHAYGNAVIELIDTASMRRLRFNVLAYGTPEAVDFAARDLRDGVVIVGTGFRSASRFGRTFGSTTFTTPPVFANESVYRLAAQYRINRDEFTQIVSEARKVDAALSTNPEDYVVDHFGLNNEIFGYGEIGAYAGSIALNLLAR